MRTTISSEWKNAGMWSHVATASRILDGDRKSFCKPWVAQITGFDFKFGFKREFIEPTIDWSNANPSCNRGVLMFWYLKNGYYETCLGKRLERSFCCVRNGTRSECSKEDVERWLNNTLA